MEFLLFLILVVLVANGFLLYFILQRLNILDDILEEVNYDGEGCGTAPEEEI